VALVAAVTARAWIVLPLALQEDLTAVAAARVVLAVVTAEEAVLIQRLLRHPNGRAPNQRNEWSKRCDLRECALTCVITF